MTFAVSSEPRVFMLKQDITSEVELAILSQIWKIKQNANLVDSCNF